MIKKYEFFTDEIRRLEPSLHTNIVEDIKKELSQEEQRTKAEKKALAAQKSGSVGGKSSYDRAVAAWVKQTLAGSVGGNVSTVADTDTDAVVTPDSSAEDSGITLYSSGSDAGSSSGSTGNEGYGLGPNGMPNIVRFPASLPTLLLPIIFRSQPIADTDINCLKKSVFSSDVLGNMTVDVSPYLLVFRGTATDTDFQKTWSKIQSRISLLSSPILNVDGGETGNLVSPGMEDRIQIFALPEYIPPESTTNSNRSPLPQEIIPTRTPSTLTEKYSSLPFNPIFVVISKSAVPRPPGLVENSISVVAGLLTFVTAMIYSTDVYSLNKVFVEQVMRGDTDTLDRVFFLALSILAVQSAHDIGHVIAANFHKLAISRPYSLPSLQIGTFGSITSFLGFPKNRKQLFDVAIAGPTLGFISALALTIYGFLITQSATPADLASFPALPTGFFTSSYLLYQLTDGFLHISNAVTSSVSSDIAGTGQAVVDAISNSFTSVHPFVAAGIIGLLVNAFNFMPIGRLDGGRVFMSIFGRKSAQSLSTVVLIAQGLSLLVNASPLPLFWIIAVVLLQRGQDIPPLDDVTPITGPAGEESKDIGYYLRLTALAFCMVMTAAVLIPMPLEISTLTSAVGSSVTDIANGNFPNGIQI